MNRYRATAVQVPRLYAVPPPPVEKSPPQAIAPSANPRPAAWIHVRGLEITVEAQSQSMLQLVDRALIAGLLRAGLAAEKEGVKLASAVSPPICYGKIRVSPEHDKETTRQRLAAARAAATAVLVEGGCDLAR